MAWAGRKRAADADIIPLSVIASDDWHDYKAASRHPFPESVLVSILCQTAPTAVIQAVREARRREDAS